jgi:hypothetical protein
MIHNLTAGHFDQGGTVTNPRRACGRPFTGRVSQGKQDALIRPDFTFRRISLTNALVR